MYCKCIYFFPIDVPLKQVLRVNETFISVLEADRYTVESDGLLIRNGEYIVSIHTSPPSSLSYTHNHCLEEE